MDFVDILSKHNSKNGSWEFYPSFVVNNKSKDLMIRGKDFYAVWNPETGLWSTDRDDVIQMIDDETREAIKRKKEELKRKNSDDSDYIMPVISGKFMRISDSGIIDKWIRYTTKQMVDNFHTLDAKVTFANTEVAKKDYISRRLPYELKDGDHSAWDKLLSVLYLPEEQHKIEWMIGSIVSGDSKKIQKFYVFYGSAGTGKSTIINIIQELFDGYYTMFNAASLAKSDKDFALSPFSDNPLIAIEHDADLSRIEDNSRLNSIVSHEKMQINEKFKAPYTIKLNTTLIIGTNRPVKITDAKSGLLRRLIDIRPTGNTLPNDEYNDLMQKIEFELGAIAKKCLDVYNENRKYYNRYVPELMMDETNDFYNFMEENLNLYSMDNGVYLSEAWNDYKQYCEDANVIYRMPKRSFKTELRNYFNNYEKKKNPDLNRMDEYFSGLKIEKFLSPEIKNKPSKSKTPDWLIFTEQDSTFDKEFKDCPAQYAVEDEEKGTIRPERKWENCKTKLKDLDTSKLHYVKTPEKLIMIDLDIKGDDGNKSFEKNVESAKNFPETYAELSKSGQGIHLYYYYDGDVRKLSSLYSENVEIKTFPNDMLGAIRRKLTLCNDIAISTINSGLPQKEDRKKMLNTDVVKSENALRKLIQKNLNKEIHPATKPSVDFIYKILEDAYNSGLEYDVSDMKQAVLYFAGNSTHNASYCLGLVSKMHFKSEQISTSVDNISHTSEKDDEFMFYDIEVFNNVLIVCYLPVKKDILKKLSAMKKEDYLAEIEKMRSSVVKLINPSPDDIKLLLNNNLIGFNCRKYDNHILYGRLHGYSNAQCYKLSHQIVNSKGDRSCFFGNAYDISYTDVYDFSSVKQSLKKFEIELGFDHIESEYPWDEDLAEEHWAEVADYCANDVLSTVATMIYRWGDYVAREILSALSGLNMNATTNMHTTAIIFGSDKNPGLVYTDFMTGKTYGPNENFKLPITEYDYYIKHKDDWKNASLKDAPKNCFPGYFYVRFEDGTLHNMYRGVDLGKGGYVYADPGMYLDGAITFDVASEHPHSIKELNLFGKYTKRFVDLMDARINIKHKNFDAAKKLFDGKLAPYLDDPKQAKALSSALKIAINSVYGLTSAKFPNPFRDERNVNNIVALRGALFMKTVQDAVAEKGYHVIHIKTDSIKIEHPDNDIQKFVMDLGESYGYTFEIEHTWDRICLVNNAVFIGKHGKDDPESPGEWDAVGTQFQIPYVFKTLFSHEEITFEDLCITKSVNTALYLDFNEGLKDVSYWEKLKELRTKTKRLNNKLTKRELSILEDNNDISDDELNEKISEGHKYCFVGKVGSFCPIKEGCNGGALMRHNDLADKYDTANDCKWTENGKEVNRWLESTVVKKLNKEDCIDRGYFRSKVDEAKDTINKFGNFEDLVA